jgi:hypothetical protein
VEGIERAPAAYPGAAVDDSHHVRGTGREAFPDNMQRIPIILKCSSGSRQSF